MAFSLNVHRVQLTVCSITNVSRVAINNGPRYTSCLMNRPSGLSRILSRSAVFLYTLAQLCFALAAFSEGRYGADARSHAESAGTSAHHAHDEASCAACSSRAMLSLPARDDNPMVESSDKATLVAFQLDLRSEVSARVDARPRAPPIRQA